VAVIVSESDRVTVSDLLADTASERVCDALALDVAGMDGVRDSVLVNDGRDDMDFVGVADSDSVRESDTSDDVEIVDVGVVDSERDEVRVIVLDSVNDPDLLPVRIAETVSVIVSDELRDIVADRAWLRVGVIVIVR